MRKRYVFQIVPVKTELKSIEAIETKIKKNNVSRQKSRQKNKALLYSESLSEDHESEFEAIYAEELKRNIV